jgi:hypothetical protein
MTETKRPTHEEIQSRAQEIMDGAGSSSGGSERNERLTAERQALERLLAYRKGEIVEDDLEPGEAERLKDEFAGYEARDLEALLASLIPEEGHLSMDEAEEE